MVKKCPRCQRILPDSYFAPNTPHCKICRRDYDWQYRYGVSPEQYLELFEAQKGKCKICGYEPQGDEYLHIDHNKKTGEIRGLLCGRCNKALGLFDEKPENLINAIKYVEGNQKWLYQ